MKTTIFLNPTANEQPVSLVTILKSTEQRGTLSWRRTELEAEGRSSVGLMRVDQWREGSPSREKEKKSGWSVWEFTKETTSCAGHDVPSNIENSFKIKSYIRWILLFQSLVFLGLWVKVTCSTFVGQRGRKGRRRGRQAGREERRGCSPWQLSKDLPTPERSGRHSVPCHGRARSQFPC